MPLTFIICVSGENLYKFVKYNTLFRRMVKSSLLCNVQTSGIVPVVITHSQPLKAKPTGCLTTTAYKMWLLPGIVTGLTYQ